jgi:competence protein ComEC
MYLGVRVLVLTLAVLTLWNPLLLVHDPGLQFSFLATLGLLVGTPVVARGLWWVRGEVVRELLASSIAAQLGVIPMLLWQTGNLSLVAIPANIAASLVIPAAMAASALAALGAVPLSHVLPALPSVLGLPAYILLSYVIHIATFSASLPYANVILPTFDIWYVPVAYGFLGLLVWRYGNTPQPLGLRGVGAAGY